MKLLPPILTLLLITVGCASGRHPPTTADHVDLARYAGRWYEIARIPMGYERDCADTTADYTPMPDGRLKIVNTCHSAHTGKIKKIEGMASVVDRESHSKLKVKFGWASGDYWIFAIDADYTAALVGTPDLKSLWVLARNPSMSGQQYEGLLHIASDKGFDTSAVRRTPQHQQSD